MKTIILAAAFAGATISTALPGFAGGLEADNQNSRAQLRPKEKVADGFVLPITDVEGTVSAFRETYRKMGKPRLLVFVNRDLIDDRGELLIQTERSTSIKTKGDPIESGETIVQIGTDNQFDKQNTKVSGEGGERLTSVQTSVRKAGSKLTGVSPVNDYEAREIEEIFQDPFFDAGAHFVDQKVAEIARRTFRQAKPNFLTTSADDREQREVDSLRESADIVVEILARKKAVYIAEVSGNDHLEERLEITATAIRLKDGLKLTQVSSDSLFGFNRRHGDRRERQARQVTSAEIIEQVSLAMMQRLQ